jgi:hypothetical protein
MDDTLTRGAKVYLLKGSPRNGAGAKRPLTVLEVLPNPRGKQLGEWVKCVNWNDKIQVVHLSDLTFDPWE